MKILLKNGTIIDGTGNKKYKGNIAVKGDKIDKIIKTENTDEIPGINEEYFEKVLDLAGKVVSPGFIDTHSHSDLKVLIDPYLKPKVMQGITTELFGQDGISMAPLPKPFIPTWRKNISGLNGDSDEIDWNYETTNGYLNMLEDKGVGLNVGYLVPHGNIRMEAMGLDNREPSKEEMQKMKDITKREMESGAYGLSTGLIYMPCNYSQTSEIIELCKIVANYDGVFTAHMRNEAAEILESMEEVIRIGKESGVKVHISHFKISGQDNWSKIEKAINLLDKAHREGISVSFDQYPYTASSTMLAAALPTWVLEGGTEQGLQRLSNPKMREQIVKDLTEGIPGWENMIYDSGFDQIFITSVKTEKNADLIGKSLEEVGKIWGKHPYEATFDLLLEEENAVGIVAFCTKEEDVIRLLQRPEGNVCTDGLLEGKPHPRTYGSFPRVLGRYARQKQALTLEEAVKKMTSKPAEVFDIKDRGVLKEGNFADIVVFDPNTIIDKATYLNSVQYPEGFELIMINGEIVVDKGVHNKTICGKILRKGII